MNRFASIDIVRGIIMMIMAIDHCASAWSKNHGGGEFALAPGSKIAYFDLAQQITREITHICAPGFQLLAGLGLAISVYRRKQAGASEFSTSLDMIARGAVLILCDWTLMHFAFGRSMFLFLVLCCIGSSTILFSVLRFLPRLDILVFGLLVLFLAPAYCQTGMLRSDGASYFRHIWSHVAFGDQGWWNVMYPIFPWVGYFAIGWWLGLKYAEGSAPTAGQLLRVAGYLLVAGIVFRQFGGLYADRSGGGEAGPRVPSFWIMAKYPPTPFFSAITLSALFALLGALQPIDRLPSVPRLFAVPQLFGRVALFFFVVHFYLYGLIPAWTHTHGQWGLPATYAAWAIGLAILLPICHWYDGLRTRHRGVLRYF